MTLNMCTLTEGIHLVIYFLLTVSRGLFVAFPAVKRCVLHWVPRTTLTDSAVTEGVNYRPLLVSGCFS